MAGPERRQYDDNVSKAAPNAKVVRRRGAKIDIRHAVRNWLLNDDAVKKFSSSREDLRKMLLDVLLEKGDEDDKGHRYMRWPDDPIEGRIKGIQAQHRVSRVLNAERAEEYLRDKGLYDKCTDKVVVLSEDKVLGLNFNGTIPDDELEALYDVSETYAFVPDRIKL